MLIRAGYSISYECASPTPMNLLLSVRPERWPELVTMHRVTASVGPPPRAYRDLFGNIAHRLDGPGCPSDHAAGRFRH